MNKSIQQSTKEDQILNSLEGEKFLTRILAYMKLSGPGWLQGAITLGGGSLAGSLFLGSTLGFQAMWIQPVAMICGVIMLSAIAYVTLSVEARPFHSINKHINPLLGWSWLIATIMANLVWVMPQFALATSAIQQNLGFLQGESNVLMISLLLLGFGLFVNWLYESGGKGGRVFDLIIKVMVGVIVLSFFSVVVALSMSGQLPFNEIVKGSIPNPLGLFSPAATYEPFLEQSSYAEHWKTKITDQQRDVTFAAFGSAVGINMTFLLPYSLLKKSWGRRHHELSITDLSVGLFIPFFIATSCVIIASASSFHGDVVLPTGNHLDVLREEVSATLPLAAQSISDADLKIHEILKKRDAGALAVTLKPFAGEIVAQKIFGLGVLGMALSTIIILMLMNGLAFQEIFSKPSEESMGVNFLKKKKILYFIGCLLSGISGMLFPYFWTGESKVALAIPTSVIGGSLIPIAYFTFLLMMNSKKILGDSRSKGKQRVIWNTLMVCATTIATLGSVWVLLGKSASPTWIGSMAKFGLIFLCILFVVGLCSFLKKERN